MGGTQANLVLGNVVSLPPELWSRLGRMGVKEGSGKPGKPCKVLQSSLELRLVAAFLLGGNGCSQVFNASK